MTGLDIAHQRLISQHLVEPSFEQAQEVVRWLGAVQAQEYAGAKWGLAQRTRSLTSAAIDSAFAQGAILRTHVMRPTWHFVTPEDIRWMIRLTAPRVNAANALYYRRLELDDTVFSRSNAVLAKSLEGGKQLTRSEIEDALLQAKIYHATDDRLRLVYLVMRAELDGVICSGALRGKQHTYALLDERAPQARFLEREEALAELARRYFTSHGPATVQDFTGWSGLAPADAREGLELVKLQLAQEVVAGNVYWYSPGMPITKIGLPIAHLLPAYDEATIAYRDHSPILDPQYTQQAIASYGILILLDGRVTGAWKRTISKKTVSIEIKPFTTLAEAQEQAIHAAAKRYADYIELPLVLLY